jgi:hypothetical protein
MISPHVGRRLARGDHARRRAARVRPAERLRSHDLDDDARERLGPRVYVSRNGPVLFLYAGNEQQARAAEAVVRELVDADRLSAEFRGVMRWHPVEEEWKDARIPLPRTEAELAAQRERRDRAERREAAEQGTYDWVVRANAPSGDDAKRIVELAEHAGHRAERIWRWVTVHVLTEEIGRDFASVVESELSEDAEVWVEANIDDADVRELPVFFLDPRMY